MGTRYLVIKNARRIGLLPIDVEKIGEERRVKDTFALTPEQAVGKKFLLTEDMLLTGRSLIIAREHLLRMGAASVITACYFARDISEISPDFCLNRNARFEVSFPWDRLKIKFDSQNSF